MTTKATLKRMKKNPKRVTIFGAIHSGNTSTKAFHCKTLLVSYHLYQIPSSFFFFFVAGVDRAEGHGDVGGEPQRHADMGGRIIGEPYPRTENVLRHW